MAEMHFAPVLPVALLAVAAAGCVPRPANLADSSASGSAFATPFPSEAATIAPGGPTPSPSFTRPTPLPTPTLLPYTVKRGDTLTSIARAFRTTPRSIAFWSRGNHPSLDPESATYRPDRLEVGWVLLLLPDAVFDEDELFDATPEPSTAASVGASPSPVAS